MPDRNEGELRLNSTHWGAFAPVVEDGRLVDVRNFAGDADPSPVLRSIPDAVHHAVRVAQPAVRKSWLEHGPCATDKRGGEAFVPVSWEKALDLVAGELKRVIDTHGNAAIYGGSYGWSSAGRFHHARSQVQRFLGVIGGFTSGVNTYSHAAGFVLTSRILGSAEAISGGTSWQAIAEHGELVVIFGGLPLRNTYVTPGGAAEHNIQAWLARVKAAGIAFCNISPKRDDALPLLDAQWLAPRPNTDTAILLGLAHTILTEGLHDAAFLARYCVGFERFRDYLLGANDGVAKTAEWAAAISELPAEEIRALARRMARSRTFIAMNWSLQRSDHGEQPFWAAIALAAMLGQIGLPGGGIGFGYGSMAGAGGLFPDAPTPTLPIGRNPVQDFIPVSRIADMLLNPGAPFQFNGRDLTYPDIKLVYWCGGNPFHHHQDLNRLRRAWAKPETVIVNEVWWTATARHADIVLPATTSLERDDIGAGQRDRFLIAMKQAIAPVGEARDDFAIFSDLAERFGRRDAFTEGRSAAEFIRHLYDEARERAAKKQMHWPDFDSFWAQGSLEIPEAATPHVYLADFRRDPVQHKLATPSGRIELFSAKLASFGYDDCLGHPAWFEPAEWLGSAQAQRYPLHLLTTQPAARLHGQMDMGRVSQATKIQGREPMRINTGDAAARGISPGDIIRVFNDRGALLAGAVPSDDIRPGVVEIATGAWYDPEAPGTIGSLDKHGNPNMLTLDKGTSRLAQGPSAQTTLVEVEKFSGAAPPVTAHVPPAMVGASRSA
jgi:biotin/methionine sulfoxide reductase